METSSSTPQNNNNSNNDSPMPLRELHPSRCYYPYPPPMATYQDVIASPQLFMDTLQMLHASLGTKFMIPVIGGKYLDLHRLFVEVTSRGGFSKVVGEKRWKEVTMSFSFPSSATNASFILRKYYTSLLQHYERIYFFNAKCWTPSPSADTLHNVSMITAPPSRLPETVKVPYIQAHVPLPQTEKVAAETVGTPAGSEVYGVIDGKFDSGYLITVKIGSEEFKGVLYAPVDQTVQQNQTVSQMQVVPANSSDNYTSGVVKRKRRKKCEIKRRDPDRPKPNRSGYNFFFQEQHAKLKPLFQGKDREISRIIGESWNKLNDSERMIYQERAMKDKERYKMELEGYRERLRIRQVPNAAVPSFVMPTAHHFKRPSKDGNYSSPSDEDILASSSKSEQSSLEDHKADDNKLMALDLEAAVGMEEVESGTGGCSGKE